MYYHIYIDAGARHESKIDLTKENLIKQFIEPHDLGNSIIVNGSSINPFKVNKFLISKSETSIASRVEQMRVIRQKEQFGILGESAVLRVMRELGFITDEFIKIPCGSLKVSENSKNVNNKIIDNKKVFIVHGHDELLKLELELFLREHKFEPVVLHKQSDKGRTVIEKFEDHSNVGFAFILLTPDDFGNSVSITDKNENRARQNVIFEFGYFIGKLGRDRVCCIRKKDVIIPSDLNGLVYKSIDNTLEHIKYDLIQELKAAGYDV